MFPAAAITGSAPWADVLNQTSLSARGRLAHVAAAHPVVIDGGRRQSAHGLAERRRGTAGPGACRRLAPVARRPSVLEVGVRRSLVRLAVRVETCAGRGDLRWPVGAAGATGEDQHGEHRRGERAPPAHYRVHASASRTIVAAAAAMSCSDAHSRTRVVLVAAREEVRRRQAHRAQPRAVGAAADRRADRLDALGADARARPRRRPPGTARGSGACSGTAGARRPRAARAARRRRPPRRCCAQRDVARRACRRRSRGRSRATVGAGRRSPSIS